MSTIHESVDTVTAESVRVHVTSARGSEERLIPLMASMVVGLTLFFFVVTFLQLGYLHRRIDRAPTLDLPAMLNDQSAAWPQQLQPEFKALAVLESNALERRYHQANVLLMSRVWARYLGFVTGMILALVGAAFILGKLREEATELSAQASAGAFAMRSTSPGLVLATLGVVLMAITIVTHQEIATADAPIYLRSLDPKPAIAPAPAVSSDTAAPATRNF